VKAGAPFWHKIPNFFTPVPERVFREVPCFILTPIWLHFDCFLAPFGSHLAPISIPFRSLFAPCGSVWLPFGAPLAPFVVCTVYVRVCVCVCVFVRAGVFAAFIIIARWQDRKNGMATSLLFPYLVFHSLTKRSFKGFLIQQLQRILFIP